MIAFLEVNYAIFNEKMASDKWAPHDEYNEEEYLRTKGRAQSADALYVIGQDVISKHEDANVTMQGTVDQELVDGISNINFKNGRMTIVREDGEKNYDIEAIKEVKTKHTGIYPTPAFIPDSLKKYFEFDTHYTPVNEYKVTKETSFIGQRTIQVFFEGDEVSVKGNLDGITCAIDTTTVSFTTELEGVSILVSGTSDNGKIILDSKNPCKLAAAEGGSMFSSIIANCDLVINSAYALNFYNEEFDGKCIYTTGDVTFEDGNYYFLLTCSGTLTDASFPKTAELGARAVLAKNLTVNDGKISIKSIGHNGAVGLAATEDLTINGGKNYIATYDDPLKIGKHLIINGGFTFTSSLTNDGTDSKSSINVNDGFICSCGPEGSEAAFDVKSFSISGGTVIGLAHKCDKPKKSKQPFFCLEFNTNVKRYVKIADAGGKEVAMLETPAYPTQTIFYSSPVLVNGNVYTLFTGNSPDSLQQFATITATLEK